MEGLKSETLTMRKANTIVDQFFEVVMLVKQGDQYTALRTEKLNRMPLVNDYFTDFRSKSLYQIKAIMHDDVKVFIIIVEVEKTDPYLSVIHFLYKL